MVDIAVDQRCQRDIFGPDVVDATARRTHAFDEVSKAWRQRSIRMELTKNVVEALHLESVKRRSSSCCSAS